MSSECPYAVGARFTLLVEPALTDVYGFIQTIEVKVVRTFPFTKSQGMKVAVTSKPPESTLPSTAFLKLYDRRYIDERTGRIESLRWDHRREREAEKVAQHIRRRDDHIPVNSTGHPLGGTSSSTSANRPDNDADRLDSDNDSDFEPEQVRSLDEKAVGQWKIERDYRQRCEREFRTECEAYRRLQTLQGVCIPEFHGSTSFV